MTDPRPPLAVQGEPPACPRCGNSDIHPFWCDAVANRIAEYPRDGWAHEDDAEDRRIGEELEAAVAVQGESGPRQLLIDMLAHVTSTIDGTTYDLSPLAGRIRNALAAVADAPKTQDDPEAYTYRDGWAAGFAHARATADAPTSLRAAVDMALTAGDPYIRHQRVHAAIARATADAEAWATALETRIESWRSMHTEATADAEGLRAARLLLDYERGDGAAVISHKPDCGWLTACDCGLDHLLDSLRAAPRPEPPEPGA